MNIKQLERITVTELEDKTLEEFLEEFDLTPLDVIVILYEEGMLDDELLERKLPVDWTIPDYWTGLWIIW